MAGHRRSIRPGGIAGTPLKDLRDDNFVGLIAGTLPVATALLLVKGKEESVMERLQGRAPWTQAYVPSLTDTGVVAYHSNVIAD